jgi:hypothetical protein
VLRQSRSPAAVLALYGGAFILGATLDSFPASSAYLVALHGFSDRQYGAIYIPQLIAAIAGALAGASASRFVSLKRMWAASLVSFSIAQVLLILCGMSSGTLNRETALAVLMVATAAFGFGFGFGGGPLNGLVASQFANSRNTAIAALHMCAGAGLAAAPYVFAQFSLADHWALGIFLLLGLTALALTLTLMAPLDQGTGSQDTDSAAQPIRTRVFAILVIAAIAYALVEGTFSNWAVLFVQHDLGLPPAVAGGALSLFWAGLTVGRLAVSVIVLKARPLGILCAASLGMIGALLLVRTADSTGSALTGFAVAGLACAGFFPMLVAFAAEGHPHQISWLASMLTAALMTGVGIGSYAIGALRASVSIRDLYGYAVLYPVIAILAVMSASRERTRSN